MRIHFYLLLLFLFALRLGAQSDRLLLPMDDGQTVRLNLFSARGSDIVQARYLPFNLRLAGPPGARAFSFQAYRESDDGPLAGATMHLLLTWGVTPEQRQEIEQLLQVRRDTFHRFVGSVGVDAIPTTDLPLITPSDDPLARLLRDNLVSSGSPPTDAGGKMALAFKFKRSRCPPHGRVAAQAPTLGTKHTFSLATAFSLIGAGHPSSYPQASPHV